MEIESKSIVLSWKIPSTYQEDWRSDWYVLTETLGETHFQVFFHNISNTSNSVRHPIYQYPIANFNFTDGRSSVHKHLFNPGRGYISKYGKIKFLSFRIKIEVQTFTALTLKMIGHIYEILYLNHLTGKKIAKNLLLVRLYIIYLCVNLNIRASVVSIGDDESYFICRDNNERN